MTVNAGNGRTDKNFALKSHASLLLITKKDKLLGVSTLNISYRNANQALAKAHAATLTSTWQHNTVVPLKKMTHLHCGSHCVTHQIIVIALILEEYLHIIIKTRCKYQNFVT